MKACRHNVLLRVSEYVAGERGIDVTQMLLCRPSLVSWTSSYKTCRRMCSTWWRALLMGKHQRWLSFGT